MFYETVNFDLEPKKLKIISAILSIVGIVFIIFAKYVGNIAIRIAMLVVFAIMFINIKSTFSYSGRVKKSSDILLLIASVIVFLWPKLLVLILGFCLLYFSIVPIVKMIKTKNIKDVLKLILSVVGIILSIVCIFNSQGMLITVIRVIGVVLVAIGCFCFYKLIEKLRDEKNGISDGDRYKFEKAEEVYNDDKSNN